jgi:hypothetical protein
MKFQIKEILMEILRIIKRKEDKNNEDERKKIE